MNEPEINDENNRTYEMSKLRIELILRLDHLSKLSFDIYLSGRFVPLLKIIVEITDSLQKG